MTEYTYHIKCDGCGVVGKIRTAERIDFDAQGTADMGEPCSICNCATGKVVDFHWYKSVPITREGNEITIPSFALPASPNPTTWARVAIDNEEWPDTIDG